MVPPPGWVGMYGQPPFMQPPMQMMPPQEVGEDVFNQAPPFTSPFTEDSGTFIHCRALQVSLIERAQLDMAFDQHCIK